MTHVIGIDLFAGAGGMSLGARQAGIEVVLAIESDSHAVATYTRNHPNTTVVNQDIRSWSPSDRNLERRNSATSILFGGPPCSGFSYSNQRTRTLANPSNWLFFEFVRIARAWSPDFVLLENVKGMTDTKGGVFFSRAVSELESLGYTTSSAVLNAADFGVPQNRHRLFILGSRHGGCTALPKTRKISAPTVRDAIYDLPSLQNGDDLGWCSYSCEAHSEYSMMMRKGLRGCPNHAVTKSSSLVIERYKCVPPGGNWEDIPKSLLQSYRRPLNCHTGLYHRLAPDRPSSVIGNFRKNMLIHPLENRGISVREAARLQSFPDSYEFVGSIGFQQQQVSNAVPPLLAQGVFEWIVSET